MRVGLVAQGIEHRSPKAGVGGSNPPGAANVISSEIGETPESTNVGSGVFGLGCFVSADGFIDKRHPGGHRRAQCPWGLVATVGWTY